MRMMTEAGLTKEVLREVTLLCRNALVLWYITYHWVCLYINTHLLLCSATRRDQQPQAFYGTFYRKKFCPRNIILTFTQQVFLFAGFESGK